MGDEQRDREASQYDVLRGLCRREAIYPLENARQECRRQGAISPQPHLKACQLSRGVHHLLRLVSVMPLEVVHPRNDRQDGQEQNGTEEDKYFPA